MGQYGLNGWVSRDSKGCLSPLGGASRLPLAIAAMIVMHERRRQGELIAHRPTGASAFQIVGHMLPRIRRAWLTGGLVSKLSL
jgi:hypothetical protein